MTTPAEADALFRAAEKLARGKSGHSTSPVTGHLKHTDGRWRSPETHERVLDLYRQADQAQPKPGFARYRMALEKLYVGDLDGAEAERQVLLERGSSYAGPYLPIWIALARRDKAAAKRLLDELNAENKRKGLPLNSLGDFELL